jgi:hypothetical protein
MRELTTNNRWVVTIVAIAVAVACIGTLACAFAGKEPLQGRSRRASGNSQTRVGTDAEFRAALAAAKFGDTIVLQAGATFVGPFTLPYKGAGTGTDADYITIQTSALSGIPEAGTRIKPARDSGSMPKIVAPNSESAIHTERQAHHFRFFGIEFAPATDAKYVWNVIDLGADYKTENFRII